MAAVTSVIEMPAPPRAKTPETLYEIIDHLSALYDTLEGLEADAPERAGLEAEIVRFEEAEVRNVDNIAGYLAFCESQQEFAAAEIKRLQRRKATWEGREERLKTTVERVMKLANVKRLEGNLSTLRLQACPASVEVLDQSIVPQEYIRVTVEESVDKDAAKKALRDGAAIDGLRLVTDKKSVRRA